MNHVTSDLAGSEATLSYPGKSHPLLIGSGYGHSVMIPRLVQMGLQDANELGIGLLEENILTLHVYI